MIAEDGVAQGAGKGAEDLSTAVGRVCGSDKGERATCDEIASEEDEVRGEGVDFVDDVLEKERLGELVEVDVAELDDAIAAEGIGQVLDADGLIYGVEVMARELSRVKSEACSGNAGAYKKFTTGEAGRLVGFKAGHRP